MQSLFGFKKSQTQDFDESGFRVPLTWVKIDTGTIVSVKTAENDRHSAVQVALGSRKHPNKPLQGLLRLASLAQDKSSKISEKLSPRFIREIEIDEQEAADAKFAVGNKINIADVFAPGDKIKVTGTSLGKGFAGVMKRHGFHGGPKSHGQSTRARHPGSIGQTTTPGHVYRGKRMAGHMGATTATVKNLTVFAVRPEESLLAVKGLIPGHNGGLVKITKV